MPARILVIEDNPANLDLMAYLLEAFGHSAVLATTGEEALQIVAQETPDLIVCDIQLPKMDGYQIAAQLKREYPKTPLIAVTAYAMVGDRDKIVAAGFDGYISKPIDPETFVPALDKYLAAGMSGVSATPSSQAVGVSAPQNQGEPATLSSAPTPEKRATILYVDNMASNRQLIASMLVPFGYEVILTDSVTHALAVAQERMPDLILSDVHMPEQDGFEFIKAVKANPELEKIPFVFLSATVMQEADRKLGLELGATDFILNPVEPQVLPQLVETWLHKLPRR